MQKSHLNYSVRTQKEPEGTQMNQKEPEGPRRNQKEPEGTQMNQKEPEGTKSTQKDPAVRPSTQRLNGQAALFAAPSFSSWLLLVSLTYVLMLRSGWTCIG